jgi:hypothetical protein
MPALTFSGTFELGAAAEQARYAVITTLIDAGLNPADYGYGYQPPAGR